MSLNSLSVAVCDVKGPPPTPELPLVPWAPTTMSMEVIRPCLPVFLPELAGAGCTLPGGAGGSGLDGTCCLSAAGTSPSHRPGIINSAANVSLICSMLIFLSLCLMRSFVGAENSHTCFLAARTRVRKGWARASSIEMRCSGSKTSICLSRSRHGPLTWGNNRL